MAHLFLKTYLGNCRLDAKTKCGNGKDGGSDFFHGDTPFSSMNIIQPGLFINTAAPSFVPLTSANPLSVDKYAYSFPGNLPLA